MRMAKKVTPPFNPTVKKVKRERPEINAAEMTIRRGRMGADILKEKNKGL